mmetsp:Transcript_47937/g.113956  ORF Transcript_47937/g.113956 Transcript_47937/m.113956 type:complete len:127 (+) Transcript_47937:61-441(+)
MAGSLGGFAPMANLQGRGSQLPELGQLPRLVSSGGARGQRSAGSTAGIGLERTADKAEALNILYEISKLLNTGLNRESLSALVDLCELGVDPEALAEAVTSLREEAERLKEPPSFDAAASDAGTTS